MSLLCFDAVIKYLKLAKGGKGCKVPKRIPNNQERNIDILRIVQDVVAGALHHLSIRNDDVAAIVFFLLDISVSLEAEKGKGTYEHFLIHK